MEYVDIYSGWLFLIVSVLFIFVYKKLSKKPDALTSSYEAEKTLPGNPANHLKRIDEALHNAGFKKICLDKEGSRFYAQTKFSIYSFSEYIEVAFLQNPGSTLLKFKSICALPTQIVAWGKNKKNYIKFRKELEKQIPE